jgi:nitrogenase subunit NifH
MLRKAFSKSVYVIALCVLSSAFVFAQSAAPKTPKYDKATETKIKGVIDELKTVEGKDEGTHFYLKSGETKILVHVGPEKFLKEIEASYAKGDTVEVIGSKVKSSDGEDEILAKEITKDNNTVTLRDGKGEPAWHGWKM